MGRLKPKMKGVVDVWRELGYDVQHICGGDLYESSSTQAEDAKAQQQFHQKWYRRLPFMSPFVQSCSERRDIAHDELMLEKLRSLVKERKPDIIWERSSRLSSAGLTVAKEIGVPFVLEWKDHLVTYSVSLHHRRAVNLEKRKNAEADFIVVESEKLRDDLAAEGVDRDKILVAHNAVKPDEFTRNVSAGSEYRTKLGIQADEMLVGYLGSYAFYHDMKRIILAADILRKRKIENIKILLVGTGKQYEETRQLAERLNLLGSTVLMEPWVESDEVPKILSAVDVAVLPGCTDIICPIKVQEYMAMELPTLVPGYDCNREVVTDGKTGILFDPQNEKSLADKLQILAEDSELRKTLSHNARQEVIERFTWEKTWGKALQDIMRQIGQ